MIVGEVRNVSLRPTRRRLTVLTAVVADESGSIPAVWFNQNWLRDKLQPGTRVRLRGQLKRGGFNVKSYDVDGVARTADLAPIYPAGRGDHAAADAGDRRPRARARTERAGSAPGGAEDA